MATPGRPGWPMRNMCDIHNSKISLTQIVINSTGTKLKLSTQFSIFFLECRYFVMQYFVVIVNSALESMRYIVVPTQWWSESGRFEFFLSKATVGWSLAFGFVTSHFGAVGWSVIKKI